MPNRVRRDGQPTVDDDMSKGTEGDGQKLAENGYTYEDAKGDIERLGELDVEQQKINAERGKIYQRMEQRGENKGVFKSMLALSKKSAAAIEAEEEARTRLFGWLIKPKLTAATEQGSEG